MSENPYKRRCREAKGQAMQEYLENGFLVYPSDNTVICFTARDKAKTHTALVRVVLDSISKQDVELIGAVPAWPHERKVIMCRHSKGWVRRVYDHLNNLCQ
jgi:hypothetical protein